MISRAHDETGKDSGKDLRKQKDSGNGPKALDYETGKNAGGNWMKDGTGGGTDMMHVPAKGMKGSASKAFDQPAKVNNKWSKEDEELDYA
jgi:hypothetical protein